MFIFVHLALSRSSNYNIGGGCNQRLATYFYFGHRYTYFRATIQVKFYAASYHRLSIQELITAQKRPTFSHTLHESFLESHCLFLLKAIQIQQGPYI